MISPYAQWRKGLWMAQGAMKYSARNWEKGIPISRCIASLFRHLLAYMMGKRDEDHLAAIAVNAEFIMHFEAMINKGLLPSSLDDMPNYEQRALQIVRDPMNSVLTKEDVGVGLIDPWTGKMCSGKGDHCYDL